MSRLRTGRAGTSDIRNRALVPNRTPVERKQQIEAQALALQQSLFDKSQADLSSGQKRKPACYERPAYNTPAYWRDSARGWITAEQQRNDHADFETRRRRAIDSKFNKARTPHRHSRLGPQSTKQYSKPMSTQAARDDRLTPQSKALLQLIVARTGRGRSTDTTKTTLGILLNRCPRSIQRYIAELIKFGYIRTQVLKSRRTGFFVGMRIWIMNSVLPYYAHTDADYDAEKWFGLSTNRRISEETKESLTKDKEMLLRALGHHKPPWFCNYAF